MSAEYLAGVAGVVLSLIFSYVPGLNAKYAALDGTIKRLIMLGLLVVVAGGAFGLACAGWGVDLKVAVSCDRAGLVGLLQVLSLAVIANQSAYAISPAVGSRKK